MNITILLVLLCCVGVVGGCGSETISPTFGINLFEPTMTTFSVVPKRVDTTRPTTLTIRCMPRVTGKGMILVGESGALGRKLWLLEQRASDSVDWVAWYADTASLPALYVEFTADKEFVQHRQVQFVWKQLHEFTFSVIMDSIYVADSNRYYALHSDVVHRIYPEGIAVNGISKYLRLEP